MTSTGMETYRRLSQLARRRWRLTVILCMVTLAALAGASAADRGRFWFAGSARPDDLWRYQAVRINSPRAAGANTLLLTDGAAVGLLGTAPPRDAEFARIAQRRLGEIVAGREVLLRIETQSARDASGRLLAHVCIDDRNIALELLKQGFLRVDRDCQTPYRDTFLAAEEAARRKHLGLWLQGSPVRK